MQGLPLARIFRPRSPCHHWMLSPQPQGAQPSPGRAFPPPQTPPGGDFGSASTQIPSDSREMSLCLHRPCPQRQSPSLSPDHTNLFPVPAAPGSVLVLGSGSGVKGLGQESSQEMSLGRGSRLSPGAAAEIRRAMSTERLTKHFQGFPRLHRHHLVRYP